MITHTALTAAGLSADRRTDDLSDPPFMLPASPLDNRPSFCDLQETRSAMPEQNKPLGDMTAEEIAELTPEQVDELDGIEPQPDPATDSPISQRIEKHRGLLEKLS